MIRPADGFLHNHCPNSRDFTKGFFLTCMVFYSCGLQFSHIKLCFLPCIVYYHSFLQRRRRLLLERRKEPIIFWRCPSLNSWYPGCAPAAELSWRSHCSGSITEPSSLRVAWGCRQRWIEWCDRHLCHVTGRDDAIVCLSVCQTITFESLDIGSSLHIPCSNTGQVRIYRSSGRGQGHRSQKRRKFLFPQCKTSIAHNSGSITDIEPWGLRMPWSFRLQRIQWWDRHLCPVTGRNYT